MKYIPILKAREGEYGALEALSDLSIRKAIVPLIEIPKVPFDYAHSRPSKSLEEHISVVAERLSKCWGTAPVFIDLPRHVSDSELLADGSAALNRVLED